MLTVLAGCLSGPPLPRYGDVPIVAVDSPCRPSRTDLSIGCVIDGDTLDVERCGVGERVRLLGIDAPETVKADVSAECFADEAKEALEDLVLGREVALSFDATCTDVYGRTLAYVWLVGDDVSGVDPRWVRTGWDGDPSVAAVLVNEVLLGTGAAAAYPPEIGPALRHQDRLDRATNDAIRGALGLWGACGRSARRSIAPAGWCIVHPEG